MDKKIPTINSLISANPPHLYWDDFQVTAYAFFDEKNVYIFNHPNYKTGNENDFSTISRTEQFNGCTLILFEDYPTAIIDLSFYKDHDTLYAILIHELFHGYQYLNNEKRFPNELLGVKYPNNVKNIELRNRERIALYKAVTLKNAKDRYHSLQQFISLRHIRGQAFKQYVEYENLLETVEGPAFYVENLALTKVSSCNPLDIFKLFIDTLKDGVQSHLNIRTSCYASGFACCLLLDTYLPHWKKSFFKSSKSLYELLLEIVQPISVDTPDISDATLQISKKVTETKRLEIRNFQLKEGIDCYIQGNITIIGFDPINMIAHHNKRLYKTFVNVKLNETEYTINKPCIITFNQGDKKIVHIHLKLSKLPLMKKGSIHIPNVGTIKGTPYLKNNNNLFLNI